MHTIDLTPEQIKYLRSRVLYDLVENQRLVRSTAFDRYGPVEAQRVHDDIAVASALVALLPNPPRPERVTLPLRFAEAGAI